MIQFVQVNLMHFMMIARDASPSPGTLSSISLRKMTIRCDVFTSGFADVDVDIDAMHFRVLMMISLNADRP